MKLNQNVAIGALVLVILYLLFVAPMAEGFTPGQKKPVHHRRKHHKSPGKKSNYMTAGMMY